MKKTKAVIIPVQVRGLLKQVGALAEEEGVKAYAVGGCVRDWLLGVASTVDVDVTVEGDGIGLAKRFGETFGVSPRVHPQFGTATLEVSRGRGMRPPQCSGGRPPMLCGGRLDVASCRKETYREPAAYPTVSRGALRDDLFRRDFTINAMAVALNPNREGTLVDPFHGLRDLRQRRLRILHVRSFMDDPSRILRAARFVPRFAFRLERATAQQMSRALADGLLGRLNRGRLRKEFARMAEEPHPQACLRCLGQWLVAASRCVRS